MKWYHKRIQIMNFLEVICPYTI